MTSKCGPTGKYCYMAFENVCEHCEECIACGECECGFREEESPVEMTEKMLAGIMAIAIIYELVKPGRVGMIRKMIDAIVAKIPEIPEKS